MSQFDWSSQWKVETLEAPQNKRFYRKTKYLLLWPTYIREKGRTLGKTYGIKARCYWEHTWRAHWESREHIENLRRTHWQLERNMLGTKEKRKKINKPPPPSLKLCILWSLFGQGISVTSNWKLVYERFFLESLVQSSMDQSKENWKNICLIFKPNYFNFFLIIFFNFNLIWH